MFFLLQFVAAVDFYKPRPESKNHCLGFYFSAAGYYLPFTDLPDGTKFTEFSKEQLADQLRQVLSYHCPGSEIVVIARGPYSFFAEKRPR